MAVNVKEKLLFFETKKVRREKNFNSETNFLEKKKKNLYSRQRSDKYSVNKFSS